MTHDFVSLALIALVAAAAPIIANLIPKKPIPETVLLLIGGALLGPSMANVIWTDESVMLLSDSKNVIAGFCLTARCGYPARRDRVAAS